VPGRADHGHVAAHHARELAGDGKAEPRAAEALCRRGIGLAEFLEQLRLLLSCHAMPVSETANSTKLLPLLTLRAASLTSPSLGRGGLEQKEMAMTEAGKNRIMIFGPKNDGTYVIEFKTAAGEALICLACYFAPNRCRDQPQKRPVVQSRGITLSYIARWQMRRASSWGRGKAKERAPTGRGRGSGLTTFTRGSQCSPLAQQNLCWVVGRCLCPRPSPRPARYKESPEGANRGALSGVTLRYRRGERHLPR
jgi:hypothetical protein